MKRVVVTGLGIVSSIGNNKQEVLESLRNGRSGIAFHQEYVDLGFRTAVHGAIKLDPDALIDRRIRRFMGDAAAFNYLAMREAIADAKLGEDQISNVRTGLIAGSGGASTENVVFAADTLRAKGLRKVGPYMVPRTMSSTTAACLATAFKIKGVDAARDGFVISGGGGVLVLEELEHARARGAKIYAELVGYGATSDGADMVQPSGEGAVRCMRQALQGVQGSIDYINAHGTSTPVGDAMELQAIKEVFGSRVPVISSTKSLTGHALGAAGAQEAIYSLLMMEHGFICASANIDQLDPAADGLPIARERVDGVTLNAVLSNSFGFGGTNAALVFQTTLNPSLKK